MLDGFWKLTWIETKVFVREPLGVIGSVIIPVAIFVVLGRAFGGRSIDPRAIEAAPFNVAILAALVIAIGGVLSLVTIIAIYREGGILKRLRATPLSPVTILGAHVLVKLGFTALSLGLLVLAGRRLFPGVLDVDLVAFTLALLLGTLSILSLGFVIASLVPTARFAQPIAAALLYPMLAVSGLFFPLSALPTPLRLVTLALPTTHAVALMQAVWDGVGWRVWWPSALGLVVIFVVCTAAATKVFRWE